MKRIIFYIIICLPVALGAQKKVTFDTTLLNSTSAYFFEKNPVIDSIIFDKAFNKSKFFQVYLKTNWRDTNYNRGGSSKSDNYNFDFQGDKYLFEKKYGDLKLPEKTINLIVKKICFPVYSLSVLMRKDSVKCILEYYCPSNEPNSEDKVFIKIEVLPRYKSGIQGLQSLMGSAFKARFRNVSLSVADSVLIYEILVDNKDSCLKRINLIEGRYSAFEQFVMDELKRSCAWLPAMQGGRGVIAYTKIFIRLNKDKRFIVDY